MVVVVVVVVVFWWRCGPGDGGSSRLSSCVGMMTMSGTRMAAPVKSLGVMGVYWSKAALSLVR